MTDIGYDNIIKKLEGILVAAPTDSYTADQLTAWLRGYTDCAAATRKVLDEMKKEQRD